MFRVQPDQYSRPRAATISPAAVLVIRRGLMARVPEGIARGDIRLPHTANRRDIVDRLTARPTADVATAVRHIKAVVAIARRAIAHPATAHPATARAATVHLATADVLTVVAAATAPRPADRRRTVAVAGPVVALGAAVLADQVVGRATPEDIANSQLEIKLLLSMPPLTGRPFFARAFTVSPPSLEQPHITCDTSCQ